MTLTLEQVMALDGTALNEAVAERLGWSVLPPNGVHKEPYCLGPSVAMYLPDFSRDWSAAMQIRDWARGLDSDSQVSFGLAVVKVIKARTDIQPVWTFEMLLVTEPIDLARAAPLVRE